MRKRNCSNRKKKKIQTCMQKKYKIAKSVQKDRR